LIQKKLTILLPLKNRHQYTVRLFHFFKEFNLKYELFIADGSKKALSSKYFSILDKAAVQYKYLRFNEDKSIKNFINKLWKSLKLIKTKYVMIFDNDDLLIPISIDQCLKHLDKDKNIVGCGGYKINFNFFKIDKKYKYAQDVYGNPVNISRMDVGNNYILETGLERIKNYLTKKESVNTINDIFHTKFLRNNISQIKNKNFSFLFFYFVFLDILNIFKGKILKINLPVIMHQHHSKGYSVSSKTIYDNLENLGYLKQKIRFQNSIYSILKRRKLYDYLKQYFQKIKYKKNQRTKSNKKFILFKNLKKINILKIFYQIIKNNFLSLYNLEISNLLKSCKNSILRSQLTCIFIFLKK
jgi:glycosyltransferase domain-containing protein